MNFAWLTIFCSQRRTMIENKKYDKLKVAYKLSKLAWFIKECAIPEEKKGGHEECLAMYDALLKDLEKHASIFFKSICK